MVPSAPALSEALTNRGFYRALMPNRGKTRFLRGVIRFFLLVGIIICLSAGTKIFAEFHARHSWLISDIERQFVPVDKNVRKWFHEAT